MCSGGDGFALISASRSVGFGVFVFVFFTGDELLVSVALIYSYNLIKLQVKEITCALASAACKRNNKV